MQSDQKVGLALGVLLIGTVAAFFFRNETHPSARAPHLARAAEVDREIAEKRLTPYLSPTEPEAVLPGAGTHFPSRSQEEDARTGERRLPRWDELQAQVDDPFAEDVAHNTVPVPAPDPIPLDSTKSANLGPSGTPPHDTADASANVLPMTASTDRVHEVQRGETLSSIAGKYLGSQARFQEIFERNRDQLRDANDLQIGMKLWIPDGKTKFAAGKSAASIPASSISTSSLAAFSPPGSNSDVASPPVSEVSPPVKFTPMKRRP